jgi:putative polyhydroxyalkanoate system protein
MPDIHLVRPFSVSVAVAKARVQKTADELADEYHLRSEWRGDTLHFDRTGLHGEIQVSGSEIRLEAHLSLLLKPLRAKLMGRIEDKFGRLFPEAARTARRTKEA